MVIYKFIIDHCVLETLKTVQYGKLKSKPVITKNHKKRRLEFAKKYITLGKKWNNDVFSDKKKV